MRNQSRRQEMLHHINVISFAVDDIKLFLNTHPDNQEALNYYQEYSRLRNEALKKYAEEFGPLTVDYAMRSDSYTWNWINDPWPWQEGGC